MKHLKSRKDKTSKLQHTDVQKIPRNSKIPIATKLLLSERLLYTSNSLKVSNKRTCLCWRAFIWFWSSEVSESIMDSQSLMIGSPMPSCCSLSLSFSVETTTSSEGQKSLLVSTRGKRSLAATSASIHKALSSLETQRKWRVFVPVNIESLLSSDLLARIEETWKTPSDFKN